MTEFDATLFLHLNRLFTSSAADMFFIVATQLGDGIVLLLLVTPLMRLGSRDTFRAHFAALVLSVALGGVLVHGIKLATDRPRPPETFSSLGIGIHAPADIPANPSFPSGHTQTAFGAAVYLSLLYRRRWPLFLLPAVVVGFSRIALGVHFPLDVLAGAAIGAGCGWSGYRINMARLKNGASEKE